MINYIKKGCLALLPMAAMAGFAQEKEINAFCEGSVWVVEVTIQEGFDEYVGYNIFSLNGACTVNDTQCLQMWLEVKDNPYYGDIEKRPFGYVYREDDKIWYVSDKADNPTCLLYDFGIEVGDIVTGLGYPSMNNPGIWQMDSKLRCDGISTQTYLGHEYTVFDMSDVNDYDWDDDWSKGQWIKGIGDARGVYYNCVYNAIGGAGYKLVQVVVDGEIVYGSNVLSLDSLDIPENRSAQTHDILGRPLPHDARGLVIQDNRVIMRK